MTTQSKRYLRLWDIIGSKKRGIDPLIPVSRSTWLAGVKSGRYPSPCRTLGHRIVAWNYWDIQDYMDSIDKDAE